jgi:RNA polymerase sigma-70 factor (ECF subfamily)
MHDVAAIHAPAAAPPAPSVASAGERMAQALQQHYRGVWRALRRLGVPEAACDDAAQHVFLTLSDKLADVPPGKERAFLMGTAARVAANARRLHRRRPEVADQEAVDDRDDDRPGPDEMLSQRQARRMLDEALDRLPEDLRTIFVLYEIEELPMVEIASSLGLPQGTVASRLRRARQRFQEQVVELRNRLEAGGAR